MGKDYRARTGREHQQFGVGIAEAQRHRGNDAGRCGHRHRCRTGGDAHQGRKQPAHQQRRQMKILRQADDLVGHAAVHQNPVQTAASAHQQGDAGRGRQALLGELEDRVSGEALGDAQRPEAEQRRQQQGDDRVADEQQETVETTARGGNQVRPATQQHQQHWQQDRRHGDAEAGQLRAGFAVEKLLCQRVFIGQVDARHDKARVHRAGNDRRRDADENGVEQGLADRRLVGLHREHGGRADHQNRHADPARDGERDGHQQHEADFEEQRQPHQKGDADHGPVCIALAEAVDQRARHLLGTAGLGHHLAKHGAQGDDQGDVPQRLADAALVGGDDGIGRHPGDQRKADRDQRDDNERIKTKARNQHDQGDDRDGGIDQQRQAG
nr:hypothetical protein [Tanacetum cinerariifolium]